MTGYEEQMYKMRILSHSEDSLLSSENKFVISIHKHFNWYDIRSEWNWDHLLHMLKHHFATCSSLRCILTVQIFLRLHLATKQHTYVGRNESLESLEYIHTRRWQSYRCSNSCTGTPPYSSSQTSLLDILLIKHSNVMKEPYLSPTR